MNIFKRGFGMTVLVLGMGLTVEIGCGGGGGAGAGGGGTGGGEGCTADSDCKGSRVCDDGVCTLPSSGTTSGSSTTVTSGTGPEVCPMPGEACSAMTCCQTGDKVGPFGAVCISNDNACHSICHAGGDCASDCCVPVNGQDYGVCAEASKCGGGVCSAPGTACGTNNPCCQDADTAGPYGATCISNDGVCHANCFAGSDCASGCCVPVNGQNHGVCGPAALCQ